MLVLRYHRRYSKMSKYQCNGTENKFWLSYICTNGSDTTGFECYNDYYTQSKTAYVIRKGLGVWLVLIGILGAFGNFYTLLSIPFASKRKKYGLDENYKTTTIFLLHLCFIDFVNCLIYILPGGITHLMWKWPFPPFGCSFIVIMGNLTVSADAIALAIVALTRCLNTLMSQTWSKFCDRKINLVFIFSGVWVEPGWDCEGRGCGYRVTCMVFGNSTVPSFINNPEKICEFPFHGAHSILYAYSIILYVACMVIIAVSYSALFYKVQRSRRVLQISDANTNAILDKREKKMIRTVLILMILNIICWLPYQLFNAIIVEVVGSDFERFYYDMFYALYFTQFSLNFFVYIARSEQYRKAFGYYLIHLKSKFKIH